MFFSFQDNDNLYLIMDLLLGGDLRYHLNKREKFNENQLKFFISCTILGLNYLHQNKIIHKDIKPENLVKNFSIYNINTNSYNLYNNNKKPEKKATNNFIDKFRLECIIGKGGFGKVSFNYNFIIIGLESFL